MIHLTYHTTATPYSILDNEESVSARIQLFSSILNSSFNYIMHLSPGAHREPPRDQSLTVAAVAHLMSPQLPVGTQYAAVCMYE